MTPEEAIALLKNPQVIQQMIEVTRDPSVMQRLRELAAGETVHQQAVELLRDPDIIQELTALAQRTELYHQLIGFLQNAAIWLAVPLAISGLTLLLVLYNTILLRRMAKGRDEE